jgi:nucleoside-diphosphate-sugar epimerase
MPERVLITGATGFVGSYIASAFVEAGYQVRCSVRASSNTRWICGLPIERVTVDFGRPGDLAGAVKDIDIVVHAAGLTRARRISDYHRINVEGTRRLAETALGAGVRRFVLISSLAARGPDALTKDGRDRPVSPYGRSKLEAETYLRSLSERMEVTALRPSAVYGPRDTDLLPLFKMARGGWLVIPPDLNPLQPVYVADVARVTLVAARHKTVSFGPFPVAEAARYTWQQMIAMLEGALERPVRPVRLPAFVFEMAGRLAELSAKPLGSSPVFDTRRARDLAVHAWTCDPSGTERALRWQAEVTLSEGLKRTARWYREVGWI